MKKKVTVTIDDFEEVEKFSRELGVPRVATLLNIALAEYRKVRSAEDEPLNNEAIILRLENASEFHDYAREKGFRNIPGFAEFAMTRYIAQYPPKKRSGVPRAASEGKIRKASEARHA